MDFILLKNVTKDNSNELPISFLEFYFFTRL